MTFATNPPYCPGVDRRRFLLTSLAGALAAPLAAGAQQVGKAARIGVLADFGDRDQSDRAIVITRIGGS